MKKSGFQEKLEYVREEVSSLNMKILTENEKQYECFRNKDEYPLENKYLTPRVSLEEGTLSTSRKFCIGLSDTLFKECYSNHKCGFRNRCYEKSTELSKYKIYRTQHTLEDFKSHWRNDKTQLLQFVLNCKIMAPSLFCLYAFT